MSIELSRIKFRAFNSVAPVSDPLELFLFRGFRDEDAFYESVFTMDSSGNIFEILPASANDDDSVYAMWDAAVWSRDKTKIYASRINYENAKNELWQVDPDGNNLTLLSALTGNQAGRFSFKETISSGIKVTRIKHLSPWNTLDVWDVSSDTLDGTFDAAVSIDPYNTAIGAIKWQEDGNRFSFVARPGGTTDFHYFTLDIELTDPQMVMDNPGGEGLLDSVPFLPNNTGRMVFSTFDGGISMINYDGSGLEEVLAPSDPINYGMGLAPSPDGTKIAFVGLDNNNVCFMDIDGTGLVEIPDSMIDIGGHLAWSDDGERLVHISSYNGSRIDIINIADETFDTIYSDGAQVFLSEPQWSPKGDNRF